VRTLVAGIGNIFLGDDGFGVEVARRLAGDRFPEGTCVADYGIRGLHLAYQLLEDWDTVILVDAVSRGATPGTVFVIEPDLAAAPGEPAMNAHGMDPATVLATVKSLGGKLKRVLVVGCEPQELEPGIGLSGPVKEAVNEAARVVRRLVGGTTI
jgi:hydrogenase maturation protease